MKIPVVKISTIQENSFFTTVETIQLILQVKDVNRKLHGC